MPNGQTNSWKQITLLLSNEQTDSYSLFADSLSYLSPSLPFLTTIGVDSIRLGDTILDNIRERLKEAFLEQVSPSIFNNLLARFRYYEQLKRPVILPLYQLEELSVEDAAAQLLFHRDIIARSNLSLIVICTGPLYQMLQVKAYDFIAFSNFVLMLFDQLAQVERDLSPSKMKPQEVEDYEEAQADLNAYLENTTELKEGVLVKRYYEVAKKAQAISEVQPAIRYYREALKIARRLKDQNFIAPIYLNLGKLYRSKGNLKRAFSYMEQALSLYRSISDLEGEASSLGSIGIVNLSKGNWDAALEYLLEALKLYQRMEDRLGQAICLGNLGIIYKRKGELDLALQYHQEALEIDRSLSYLKGVASDLGNIGLIYEEKGDMDEALKHHKEALAIDRKIGDLRGIALDLGNIGTIYFNKDELDEALAYHKEALQLDRQIGFSRGIAEDYINIAKVYRTKGKFKQALRYLKWALSIFENSGMESGKNAALDYIRSIEQEMNNK